MCTDSSRDRHMTFAGTFVLLELSTGPSQQAGGMVVKDLLCGEVLSLNANCLNRVGGLLYEDCNAPCWRSMIRSLSPSLNRVRRSLPSKCGDHISPCYIHQSTLPPSVGDIVVTTGRRENPTPKLCKAGSDASLVADLVIYRPTLAELGEAVQVLQERVAQTSFRLSARYINTLLGFAGESLEAQKDDCSSRHRVEGPSATQFRYIATACVSISAKMDDSSLASLGRFSGEDEMIERRIRDKGAIVLQALAWKLLGVTESDFVDNMLAHLPLSGIPSVHVL